MDRRVAECDAAIGLELRIVIIEAGNHFCRHSRDLGVDDRARRDCGSRQLARIRRVESEQRRERLLVLAAQVAVHDHFDAVADLAGHAEYDARAGLVRKAFGVVAPRRSVTNR